MYAEISFRPATIEIQFRYVFGDDTNRGNKNWNFLTALYRCTDSRQ